MLLMTNRGRRMATALTRWANLQLPLVSLPEAQSPEQGESANTSSDGDHDLQSSCLELGHCFLPVAVTPGPTAACSTRSLAALECMNG